MESMDLDAIADEMRTLAGLAERHNAEGVPLGDDFSTHLADLAEQVAMWHEAVEE